MNLNDADDFLSIVEKFAEIIRSQNNTAFCFERGVDLLITAFHDSGFVCRNMKLVLFSNGLSGNMDRYYDYLENQFTILNLFIPKLVLWNLSKRELCDMPCEKVLSRCVLLSGFSTSLMKYIATMKKDDCAYDIVERVLKGERYDIFSKHLEGNLRFPFKPSLK